MARVATSVPENPDPKPWENHGTQRIPDVSYREFMATL